MAFSKDVLLSDDGLELPLIDGGFEGRRDDFRDPALEPLADFDAEGRRELACEVGFDVLPCLADLTELGLEGVFALAMPFPLPRPLEGALELGLVFLLPCPM